MTDEEAILMVEAEIDRHQARRRAKRIVDAARQQLLKNRCRRQGIATSSAQCQAVMARADEALLRTTESTRRPKLCGALWGWSPSGKQLLNEAGEPCRLEYPWALPDDDGTIPT